MSGSASLSAAKRRRAEQQQTSQQQQQQPTTGDNKRVAPRIVTPMSILEDHELRLRHIESLYKDDDTKLQSNDTNKNLAYSTTATTPTTDNSKNETSDGLMKRVIELENLLHKKISLLETELSSISLKHSNLQTFAMETNSSFLKHKDTFEPGVVNRLIDVLLDKNTNKSDDESPTFDNQVTILSDNRDGEIFENKVHST